MNPGDYLPLYFEEGGFGCGWRHVVLLELGRKWALVGDAALGTTGRVPLAWVECARPQFVPASRRRRMAFRLARTLRLIGQKPTAAQRRMIALLRAPS